MTDLQLTALTYSDNSDALYSAVRHLPHPVWLDSGNNPSGRYDIISAAPSHWLSYPSRNKQEKPFELLEQALGSRKRPTPCKQALPFYGGAIGYFSYDLGRSLEKLASTACDDIALPEMAIGIYEWALIQDHQEKKCWLMQRENADPSIIEELLLRLQHNTPTPEGQFSLLTPFNAMQHKVRYLSAVERIQAYIRAGDCYQVNYTQRFSSSYQGDLFTAYKQLRKAIPSPFSALMEMDEGAVLCISPERFIKVTEQEAETRPIKGTIARSKDPKQDNSAAQTLLNSSKDKAENLMIVDLMRNDFSKNCKRNSVQVSALFQLESYRNVHHLVSTVTGELKTHSSALDLLRDCFPGGSITGAPKKRAMEIIEETEPCRRSVYCGSIGYISDCGRIDTNIAIRTLLADGKKLHCWGGGGITTDSDPEAEYQESLSKINLLLKTLEKSIKKPDQ